VEPQQNFSALEPGRYEVIVTDSELKDTKAGTGQYLQLTFEVVGNSAKGRKLWTRLNVSNPNKTAEEIAFRELAAICQSTGVAWPLDDSEDLHNIPLMVDVVQERNPVNESIGNKIKGYAPSNLALDLPEALRPTPKPAGAARQPWAKK
jgi:hypothetical protein